MKSSMEAYLRNLEDQIPKALAIGRSLSLPANLLGFSTVLFCGVGGSSISGDILRVLFKDRSRMPLVLHQQGKPIPKWAGRDTLVILSSYSGNTREVLDIFNEAIRVHARILAVTSGGELFRLAQSGCAPLIKLPPGMPPRCSIGYLTFSLFPVLKRLGCFSYGEREIRETIFVIRTVSRTEARRLARRVCGRPLHIYATSGLMEPAAIRWRTQFAENAKALVSHRFMPEMFHNEIEGWQFPKKWLGKSVVLFFKDLNESLSLKRKRKFARDHIRRQGGQVIEIPTRGQTPLARLFSLIILGDWVSYELARLEHVDPIAIPILDAIKKI
ncbi:MAG: bifunctional phosphoglucose/phosphomannose isomerase [Candidatus Omnitrophica bacterium]|nr:bifunctional phosphoglucose/phosphomannose isomerase [Candidatus Omnitrophota bacterium]